MMFDKYSYYEATVQCVENDIEFIDTQFKKLTGNRAATLREDFGGTGKLACEWVRLGNQFKSWAIDLDGEPIHYGKEHHHSKLNDEQKERMSYVQENVLNAVEYRTDIVVAFNFSYFCFKKRKDLLEYFKSVYNSLNDGGMFFIDLFGGTEAQDLVEEETEYDDYSYFWDCDKFDPISNECIFKIHFKPKGKAKVEDVFVYDWRLWSLPELREIMEEAGFPKTVAYWEEDDEDEDDDSGSGEFYISESEENCESWVTYIAGIK